MAPGEGVEDRAGQVQEGKQGDQGARRQGHEGHGGNQEAPGHQVTLWKRCKCEAGYWISYTLGDCTLDPWLLITFSIFTVYFVLCAVNCVLCTVYCVMCIVYCVLCCAILSIRYQM